MAVLPKAMFVGLGVPLYNIQNTLFTMTSLAECQYIL